VTRAHPPASPEPIRQPFRTTEVAFGGIGPAGGVSGSARFDDNRLPFIVKLTWEYRGDFFECIHLEQDARPLRGITQRLMRTLPVDELLLDAVDALLGRASGVRFPSGSAIPLSEGFQLKLGGSEGDEGLWLGPSEAGAVLRRLHRARRHGGHPTTDVRDMVDQRRQGKTTGALAEARGMDERHLRRLLGKEQRRQAGPPSAGPDGQPEI
jgi:hypothetical protein